MKSKLSPRRRIFIATFAVFTLILVVGNYLRLCYFGTLPIDYGALPVNVLAAHDADARPSALTTWPWENAKTSSPHNGVQSWIAKSPDGTLLVLNRFDFATNKTLRLELFDADEDDAKPWDNNVEYWPRGVAQITRLLNAQGSGKVVACWNGLFFGYREGGAITGKGGHAFHVSPVVIDQKVHNFGRNHRWTIGIEYSKDGKPTFSVAHLASKAQLQHLDYGGGSAQCLVLNGQPLRLQPFPKAGDAPIKQPVASTPNDVGHIPIFDHMKTSRASFAWSKDSKKLWVLWVKEPDSESGSAVAMRRGLPVGGGWTVPDLQRFWLSLKPQGVFTAINSDAGDVLQTTQLRADGNYDLIPPGWATREYQRKTFAPDFVNAPNGGALMYFYVRDVS